MNSYKNIYNYVIEHINFIVLCPTLYTCSLLMLTMKNSSHHMSMLMVTVKNNNDMAILHLCHC